MIDDVLERQLLALALERDALRKHANRARREAAEAASELAPAVAIVDVAITVVRYMREHPLLAMVGMAAASRFRGPGAIGAASITWGLLARLLR